MHLLPLLYISWTALAALFLALLVYRSQLTRYEDEKLFLADHDPRGEQRQNEIIRKANRLQPLVLAIGTATGIMSAGILGFYVYQAILVIRS